MLAYVLLLMLDYYYNDKLFCGLDVYDVDVCI